MDTLALAAALSIAGAIVVGMLSLYQASASPRSNVNRRLGAIMSGESSMEMMVNRFEGLRTHRVGRVPIISNLLEGRDWTTATAGRLERADIRLTVSEFVGVRIFVALIMALIPMFFVGGGALQILLVLVAVVVGYMLPSLYVTRAANNRVNKLTSQLPEALSLISNSIKAGFGLMQALDLSAREMPHPFSTEVRRTLHDINVGAATDEALLNMAKRSGSEDLDIVITAMLIQQATGGNLAEILDNVAFTMRERIRIRGEIKTLTSQQMLTGWVIGGLPFAMIVLFSLVNPAYMEPLFTETMGHVMLAGAAVLELFGIMLIKKILAIEV